MTVSGVRPTEGLADALSEGGVAVGLRNHGAAVGSVLKNASS